MFYPVLGGVFFGMRAGASERAQRTAAFVGSLPISVRVLGLIKLAAASTAAVIPIVMLGLLASVVRPVADGTTPMLWKAAGGSVLVTLHILLVVAVFGTGQSSEILAGIRGFLAVAVWAAAALSAANNFPENDPLQYVRWIGPPVEWLIIELNRPENVRRVHTPQLWPAIVSMLLLAFVFVARYGQAIRPLPERLRRALAKWMPARFWSPLAALAWKQAVETIPMSLAVLGSRGILSLLWGWEAERIKLHGIEKTLEVFSVFAGLGGFLLALLIGVGTFSADLEPRVNTFWRSRPISAQHLVLEQVSDWRCGATADARSPGAGQRLLDLRSGPPARARVDIFIRGRRLGATLAARVCRRRGDNLRRAAHTLCVDSLGRGRDPLYHRHRLAGFY